MARSPGIEDDVAPHLLVTAPTFTAKKSRLSKLSGLTPRENDEAEGSSRLHKRHPPPKNEKHVRLEEPSSRSRPMSSSSSIYMGSYGHSPRHSPNRSRASLASGLRTPDDPGAFSPRPSMSQIQLEHLLRDLDPPLETYGVEEYRDGFFDGVFNKPPKPDTEYLMKMARETLPQAFEKSNPLSPSKFFPKQWHEMKGVFWRVTTTRAGIKLTKSFSAFFIAYILCLVPVINDWLGRYSYVMVLSTIINHPGRTCGAMLDGVLLTVLGTAAGLGWGAFALWLSDSTTVAADGYGGILATFLLLFMGIIAAVRTYFIRSYQMVLCAGIAVIFTCISDTSRTVNWAKLFSYGIPWLLGQSICLLVCFTIFPDAGARPLAVAFHDAFAVMQYALKFPREDSLRCHRRLAWTFVNLSLAYRDLVLDISVTRFAPSDVMDLRNLMQGVVRSLLSLKTETELFDDLENPNASQDGNADSESVIDIDEIIPVPQRTEMEEEAVKMVIKTLAEPTKQLLSCMQKAIRRCDAVLLDMSSYRKYLGPPMEVSSDILGALTSLRKAMIKFDEEDDGLMDNPALPPTYSDNPAVVSLFLFVNPIRQSATSIEALLVKVMEMQQRDRKWTVYLPKYPITKGLQRTNSQVRHDRGGVTAGFYFHSQRQLNRMMHEMQRSTYKPLPRHPAEARMQPPPHNGSDDDEYEEEDHVVMDSEKSKKTTRYKLWIILHRLQGFETRFALKVAIVTSLLAVPAWLSQSSDWYNEYQSWWAVVMVWIMMHPRVGGNFQDLVTRSLCAALGAIWGGFAYAAGDGNPYVMAVFAAIYMIPMIYRFTQSSHPRSGIVGCISFTVVSLTANTVQGTRPITVIAWTHGVAFVVGVVAAVVVNWILWPFVARHELRKSLSSMLLHMAIIYRGVIADYVYYEYGKAPGQEAVTQSELLEGRLREGFVRIRQLMALTRHEIRLRGPFNAHPYSALIFNCESFFEHLVEVRQSSLFFRPNFLSEIKSASDELLPYRRDAVAAILMNLYILAGALRGNRKVPRYLPSAAAARKRLLDRMAEVELEHAQTRSELNDAPPKKGTGRKFAEVYQYAYSQALTQCVEQLEQLQQYTKAICGEVGFDPINDEEYENESRGKSSTHGALDGTFSR